jgi:hypothetical protein
MNNFECSIFVKFGFEKYNGLTERIRPVCSKEDGGKLQDSNGL